MDVVLLSDVVYGSNPGVWERLAGTLEGLCLAGRCGRDGSGGKGGGQADGADRGRTEGERGCKKVKFGKSVIIWVRSGIGSLLTTKSSQQG